MRIAVIGAGIIGVTTAFELAVDGHDVTVFERRSSVAEETSFANAGVMFKEIGPDEARKIEPAINGDTEFVGAIHLPLGEVGNCRQFALQLKGECQQRGVGFEFASTVAPLDPAAPGSLRVTNAEA